MGSATRNGRRLSGAKVKKYARTSLRGISILLLIISLQTTGFVEVTLPYFARTFPGEPRIARQELISTDLRICGTGKSHLQHLLPCFANMHLTEAAFCIACNPSEHGFASFFVPIVDIEQSRAANVPLRRRTAAPITFTGGVCGSVLSHPRIDFVDFSVETGVTLPSPHRIGSASGGFPLKGTLNVGIFDWLTAGIEGDIIFFIRPLPGMQKNACWYLKADHFMRGFSALIGYSHSSQRCAPVIWYPTLPYWSMHTIHFSVSFDAAREGHPHLPWVEFFYDRVLSGRDIGGYSLFGFQCGVYF
ncbi:MAG: hypothetical protein M1549_00485 [Candidatus Dependentiae bacterium]|nr:hypothetical protein [Candidatus Dependentiae bacterium]